MVKPRRLFKTFREEIIALHRQGKGYKKIAKALNVPRDTEGSIVHKFKVKGPVATLPGRGRKRTGCHQSPEEAGHQKPSTDCKRPAATLGGSKH